MPDQRDQPRTEQQLRDAMAACRHGRDYAASVLAKSITISPGARVTYWMSTLAP